MYLRAARICLYSRVRRALPAEDSRTSYSDTPQHRAVDERYSPSTFVATSYSTVLSCPAIQAAASELTSLSLSSLPYQSSLLCQVIATLARRRPVIECRHWQFICSGHRFLLSAFAGLPAGLEHTDIHFCCHHATTTAAIVLHIQIKPATWSSQSFSPIAATRASLHMFVLTHQTRRPGNYGRRRLSNLHSAQTGSCL